MHPARQYHRQYNSQRHFCRLFDQVRALKQTILEQAAGTSSGLNATDEQRKAIGDAVNGLVALNPTKDISTSELATGGGWGGEEQTLRECSQ